MSIPAISQDHLTLEERLDLKRLTHAPKLAWPTVISWVVLSTAVIVSDFMGASGRWPLWVCMLVISAIGYVAFSIVHDAIHRSISTNLALNDWIGRLALLLVVPYATLDVFRWNHIQHHRFANGPNDPDRVFQGPWWQLPVRWMFIDGFYLIYLFKNPSKGSRARIRAALRAAIISLLIIGALIVSGYALEVLMLWFIPSRLIMFALGFSFFWLPHVPHDTVQAENFTRATTVRLGYEPVMNLLLQYQNFHLIHHLYPNTPFYNNARVWHLLEPALLKMDLAIQHGFALRPTIYPSGVAQSTLGVPASH